MTPNPIIKTIALVILVIVVGLRFVLSVLRLQARHRSNFIKIKADELRGTPAGELAIRMQPRLDAAAWKHDYWLDALLTLAILLNLAARLLDIPELAD